MSDFTNRDNEQNTTPERSSTEWFSELKGRVEQVLAAQSLTANSGNMQLPTDELGLPAWMRLGLYVEQVRGQDAALADVALSACWGRTENSADLADVWLARSRLEMGPQQFQNLGHLALLEICVTEAERAAF